MTDIQTLKFLVSSLKTLGHGSQKEIGVLVGYANESAFSQVLNGKALIPKDLPERLMAIDTRVSDMVKRSLPKDSTTSLGIERETDNNLNEERAYAPYNGKQYSFERNHEVQSKVQELKDLADLYRADYITKEEYEKLKLEIINRN